MTRMDPAKGSDLSKQVLHEIHSIGPIRSMSFWLIKPVRLFGGDHVCLFHYFPRRDREVS